MLSAICFILDQSENLSSGNELLDVSFINVEVMASWLLSGYESDMQQKINLGMLERDPQKSNSMV